MNDQKKVSLARRMFDLWWARYPHRRRGCRTSAQDAFVAAVLLSQRMPRSAGGEEEAGAGDEESDLVAAVLAGDERQLEQAALALADHVRHGLGHGRARPGQDEYVVCVPVLGPYRHGSRVGRRDLERIVSGAPALARLIDLGAIKPVVEYELLAT